MECPECGKEIKNGSHALNVHIASKHPERIDNSLDKKTKNNDEKVELDFSDYKKINDKLERHKVMEDNDIALPTEASIEIGKQDRVREEFIRIFHTLPLCWYR